MRLLQGGSGSGNYGHKGRPGQQGGSGQGLPEDTTEFEFTDEDLMAYDSIYDPNDEAVVEFYCGEGYDSLNRYLRNGDIPEDYMELQGSDAEDGAELTEEEAVQKLDGVSKSLDDLIGRTPALIEDKVVYRYTNKFPFSVGDTFVDKGFVSTSFDPNLKKNVIRYGGMKTEIRIWLPTGTRFALLSGFATSNQSEGEILLPRNSKFRVMKIWGETPATPNKHVDLELIQ